MMNRLTPGTILQSRYRIIRLLGQGGMGAVYLAEDQNLPGRLVAVKENSETSSSAQDQFEREALILARLKHQNLPQVTDHFVDSLSGRQYLVMEYVEGEDLEQILSLRGPLPETEVLGWVDQVIDALEYMHSQNPPVIHRDIKPANIKLTIEGTVKLIDFGIVRFFKPGQTKDTAALGTPGYAAPEQYGTGQSDARTDIYSLGVTLHQLLTGHDPVTAPFNLPPVRKLNPDVSPHVESAIRKATQANRDDRFQTVAELRKALIKPTAVQPLQQVCSVCGASNRTTARFCTACGTVLKETTSLPDSWTVELSASLSQVKTRLFEKSRTGLVNNIVTTVLKEDASITGITIMLKGLEGFGGTSIATRIKDEILSSHKREVTLVAAVDLSDPTSLSEPTSIFQEILMALRRGSGPIGHELRSAVQTTYYRQMDAKRPVTREIETQRHTSLTPFPIRLEVATPWGTASLGSPYVDERQVAERKTLEPLDATQLVTSLLDAIRELVDYLVLEDARIVLIFDKVKDITLLRPVVPIISRQGVYSIVVANIGDYNVWKKQNPDILKRLSKKDFYVPCVWDLPLELCTSLFEDHSVIDSQEVQDLRRFLEYRGRGIPDRTIKAIERFYVPPKKSSLLPVWAERILSVQIESPAQIAISKAQWPEIRRCADLQQRLEGGWTNIFGDPHQGPLSLSLLTEETADRARNTIYTLTDWLLYQAERGTTVDEDTVTEYGLTECEMPFSRDSSKVLVSRFLKYLAQENKILASESGLDLSPMLRLST